MNKLNLTLIALSIIGVFFGGFYLGVKVSTVDTKPLDPTIFNALKEMVEERNGVIAEMEENPREVIKVVREEVRADAAAISEVVAPSEVVAFDLKPDEVERGELIYPTIVTCTEANLNEPIEFDPCLPSEFTVNGVLQKVGNTFVMNGRLYHEHGGDAEKELVWSAPLKGNVSGWAAPPPIRKFWFVGPTAGLTIDGEPTFGAMGGFTWTHFLVAAQGDNTGFRVGVAWRGR